MLENKMADRARSVLSAKSVYSASSKVTGKSRSTNEFKQQQRKKTNFEIYGGRLKLKPNVHNFKYCNRSSTPQPTSSTLRRKMYDAFLSQKELTLSKHKMRTGRSLQRNPGNSLAGAINTKFSKLARRIDEKLLKPSLKHTMARSISMNSPNMNYGELSYNWLDTTPTAVPVSEVEHTKEFVKPCKKLQKKKSAKCDSNTEMANPKKESMRLPKLKHESKVKRTLPSENISIKTRHRPILEDLRKLMPVEKSNSLSLSPFAKKSSRDRTKNDLYSFFVDLLETTFNSNDLDIKASQNTLGTSSIQSSDTNTVLLAADQAGEKNLIKSASKMETDLFEPQRVLEPRRVYRLPKVNIPDYYNMPKRSNFDTLPLRQRKNITSMSTLVQDHVPKSTDASMNKEQMKDAIIISAGAFSDPEESSIKMDLKKPSMKSPTSGHYLNAVDPRTARRVRNIMHRKRNTASSSAAKPQAATTKFQLVSAKSRKKVDDLKNNVTSLFEEELLEEDGNMQLFKSLKSIVEGVKRREKALKTRPHSDEILQNVSKENKCKLTSRKLVKSNKRRRLRKAKPTNLQTHRRKPKRIPLKTSMRRMTPSRTPKSKSSKTQSLWSQPPPSRSQTPSSRTYSSKSRPYSAKLRPPTPRSQTGRPLTPKPKLVPFDFSEEDMSYRSLKVFDYEEEKLTRKVAKETEILTLEYTSSEEQLKEDPSLAFMVAKGVMSSDMESVESQSAFAQQLPQSWMEKMGKDWKIPTI